MTSVQCATTPFAAALRARGLTNREAAHLLGTGETQVSKWRRGSRPSPEYRQRLIERLGLTAAELVALGWPEAPALDRQLAAALGATGEVRLDPGWEQDEATVVAEVADDGGLVLRAEEPA